jgi:THO complex subunit 2
LGKLSHANPIIVFDTIIDQLQSYENMVQPVVDALKYLTNLSFDILGCKDDPVIILEKNVSYLKISFYVMFLVILIEALSNPDKPRLKEDGTNLSSWLQSKLRRYFGYPFVNIF